MCDCVTQEIKKKPRGDFVANSLRNIQMNQLLTISKENTSTLTMSSREIAELINKTTAICVVQSKDLSQKR